MTLDEAIKHSEEVAEEHTRYNRYGGFESWNDVNCTECAKEHRQLANWLKELKELKQLREQEPCEDAVSRQAVLDTLDKMNSVLDEDRTVETYKELLAACYKDLPSVKPVACIATVKFSKEDMQELVEEKMKNIVVERKKGKWIPHRAKYDKTVSVYECNICHKNNGFENSKYCPNCGAEMESEE